jgi:uncharacterized protein
VDYIQANYGGHEVKYNLTTNGSLLDVGKAKWLMEHDFNILVSLDGPEPYQDGRRTYENGDGTFRDVSRNLSEISRHEYPNISLISTFDWGSDLFLLGDFFINRSSIPLQVVSQVSYEDGSKYYRRFSEEDYLNFLRHMKKARSYYLENAHRRFIEGVNSYFERLFLTPVLNVFKQPLSRYAREARGKLIPFTAACCPGRKLFVDTDGTIHICERINRSYPIGTVQGGISFESISKILKNYLLSRDSCQGCNVMTRCTSCYVRFMTGQNYEFLRPSETKWCKSADNSVGDLLTMAYTLAERYPDVIESGSNISFYGKTRKFYG